MTRRVCVFPSLLFFMLIFSGRTAIPGGATAPAAPPAPRARAEKGTPSPPLLPFLLQRDSRRWTGVPRRVLAFYYTWYGRPERNGRWLHWAGVRPEAHSIASATHYPSLGAYDSRDPAVMDRHIEEAKAAGIDGFICTWWGRGTYDDRAFEGFLRRAEKQGFLTTLYWEQAPGRGAAQVRRAVEDLCYVLEKYAPSPAFLKVEGRPVIFVYGRVMASLDTEAWRAILSGVHEKIPGGFLLVADGLHERNARLFDGIHTYNVCGAVKGKEGNALRAWAKAHYGGAVRLARSHGKIACATVIPGYDDTRIRTPGLAVDRRGGALFRTLLEEAIAADPDWVLVTSFNEWHEGSEIEPSFEYGRAYLELLAPFAHRFKARPPVRVRDGDETSSGPDPEDARRIRALFQGRTVGVLPGFASGAALRLAEAGVRVRELSWEGVVDPARFDAARFPVLLYAGGEAYRRSVRKEGDVDRALLRWLRAGGLLVVLPSGPAPFHYDERGRPVAAARRFGLPLRIPGDEKTGAARGWEHPPPGKHLTFELDRTVFPGLPERIPFPSAGDLRWRPVDPGLLSKEDRYVSLIRLVDEAGAWYGDAAAFIEHTVSPPVGGRILYAWRGLLELPVRDRLLFSLFALAGREAGR